METKTVPFYMDMDAELQYQTNEIMKEIGLSISDAFTMFCKAVVKEKDILDLLPIDPFYSKENIDELKRRIKGYESGETQMIDMTAEFEDII